MNNGVPKTRGDNVASNRTAGGCPCCRYAVRGPLCAPCNDARGDPCAKCKKISSSVCAKCFIPLCSDCDRTERQKHHDQCHREARLQDSTNRLGNLSICGNQREPDNVQPAGRGQFRSFDTYSEYGGGYNRPARGPYEEADPRMVRNYGYGMEPGAPAAERKKKEARGGMQMVARGRGGGSQFSEPQQQGNVSERPEHVEFGRGTQPQFRGQGRGSSVTTGERFGPQRQSMSGPQRQSVSAPSRQAVRDVGAGFSGESHGHRRMEGESFGGGHIDRRSTPLRQTDDNALDESYEDDYYEQNFAPQNEPSYGYGRGGSSQRPVRGGGYQDHQGSQRGGRGRPIDGRGGGSQARSNFFDRSGTTGYGGSSNTPQHGKERVPSLMNIAVPPPSCQSGHRPAGVKSGVGKSERRSSSSEVGETCGAARHAEEGSDGAVREFQPPHNEEHELQPLMTKSGLKLVRSDDPFKVIITQVLSGNTCYAMLYEDSTTFNEMHDAMQIEIPNAPDINHPRQGCIYACYYDQMYWRARVMSVHPLKVFYIDFGNEETNPDTLKALAPSYRQYSPFVFKMEIVNIDEIMDDEWCYKKVVVKRSQQHKYPAVRDLAYVDMIDVEQPPPQTSVDMPEISDEIIKLQLGEHEMMICSKLGDRTWIVIPMFDLITQILEYVTTNVVVTVEDINFRPLVGDIVAVYYDFLKMWARGKILSIKRGTSLQYRAMCLDFGVEVDTNRVKQLQQQYKDIPIFLHVCEITDTPPDVDLSAYVMQELYTISVMEMIDECSVRGKFIQNPRVTFRLYKWNPFPEQLELNYYPIESGTITISAISDEHIYLRTTDENAILTQEEEMQDYMDYCLKASPMTELKLYNEIVFAHHPTNGNWYRGQVCGAKESGYRIRFIDYGYVHTLLLNELRTMPPRIKTDVCLAVPVNLTGMKLPWLLESTIKYLEELCKESIQFRVEWDRYDTSSVKLSHHDISINEVVICRETPQLPRGADIRYSVQFVRYIKWPIHSKRTMLVIEANPPQRVLLVDINSDVFEYVFGELRNKIQNYCSQNDRFVPRAGDVCLAKHYLNMADKEEWFRAVCTGGDTLTMSLVGLDYCGNIEVSVENIRNIKPEFLRIPASCYMCYVKGEVDITTLVGKEIDIKILAEHQEPGVYDVQLVE